MENNISDKIDLYLDGKMSVEESSAFEKEISSNETLRQQVEMQKNLRQGIERLNLKSSITSQFRKMTLKSKIYKWGIATVAIAAIGTATYFGYNQLNKNNSADNYTLPNLNEEGKAEWSDADKNLPTQLFSIDPNKDTVLETDGGIVFAIPAGAFLDAKEPVTLEVREALTPMDIMKGGLSTMSDGKLLETGGMFYLNARNGEQSLKINPAKPVYANVPTNEIKSDMQLFTGERKADGSINWKNPKPLEKQLIPVDIHSLDFYPKGFCAKVAELGFDASDKRVTDSIYYSYSGRRDGGYAIDLDPIDYEQEKDFYIQHARKEGANGTNDDVLKNLPVIFSGDSILYLYDIDPARISAIWNDKFQSTIIATKEFEERLQVIYKYGQPQILDLYLNNLDKKMYQIDSLAMNKNTDDWVFSAMPEFHDFYLRHDGGISIKDSHMKELQNYFNLKRKAVQEAMEKTFANRIDKEAKEDKAYNSSKAQQTADDEKRNADNLNKELDINLTEACKQLGIPPMKNSSSKSYSGSIPNDYYSVPIINPGWCNIDRCVDESTRSRTTIDYTDLQTGKKAVIKYEPVTINIFESKNYDQLTVYLIPDSLKSFMKVNGSHGKYSEKLNELFNYDLIIIGEKDGKYFWGKRNKIKPENIDLHLEPIVENQLKTELNSSFSTTVNDDFKKEMDVMQEEHDYKIQMKARQKQEEIDSEIMTVIFPYYFQNTANPFGGAMQPQGGQPPKK